MSPTSSESSNNPTTKPRRLLRRRGVWVGFGLLLAGICLVSFGVTRQRRDAASRMSSTQISTESVAASVRHDDALADKPNRSLTMAQVIDRAKQVRRAMSQSVHDYTATFVKQERSADKISDPSVIFMKVQTPFRTAGGDAPKHVFLRFIQPADKAGRKVIWGEDLYGGKMAVHEVGMLLGLKTIWLDPNGMIAMQGQRYPISEIGLVKLVDKLIERAERDAGNPDLSITLTTNHEFNGLKTDLLRVRREKPSDDPHDFSVAEIVLDPRRMLILQYRSFGWPDPAEGKDGVVPLLESYSYLDVQLNVGLSDIDFDVKNPQYAFPAF